MLGIRYDPGRKAADVVQARRAADEALKPLIRGEALEPLPGTRREIEAIARLFPVGQVTTLLGAEATERAVQERARSGELKGYRFLHFATHGQSNPAVAMSSAVMLAPDPDRPADPTAPRGRRPDHRRPDRPDLGPRRRPGRALGLRDGPGPVCGRRGLPRIRAALFIEGRGASS